MNEKKTIRGVRIRTMNYIMILAACILYILVLYATIHISLRFRQLISDTNIYTACLKNSALIMDGSDYLTEQVRLFSVDHDLSHMDAYFEEANTTKRRDHALQDLENYPHSQDATHFLERAVDRSNELMELEYYSMKLACISEAYDMEQLPAEIQDIVISQEDLSLKPGAMADKARTLVFDDAYEEVKSQIASDISSYNDSIVGFSRQKQIESSASLAKMIRHQRILISILFVLNIVTFIIITLLIVKPLQIYIRNIKDEQMLEIAGSYEFKYLALTYNDIYEVNAANEAMLRHKAEHDPLTGLLNRGAFEQFKKILKMQPAPLALFIIDVDKFKLINDGYGHGIGDQVLKRVAYLLQENFRSTDIVARIGGDEFSVIMTDVEPSMKQRIQDKVKSMNDMLLHPADGLPEVSLSIGIAFSPRGFSDELYNNADQALYHVKEHGRCGCSFFIPTSNEENSHACMDI